MAEDLKKKRRSRQTHISQIDKLIEGDVKKIYEKFEEKDVTLLITLKDTISKKLEKVLNLNEDISELIEDDDELERDCTQSTNFEIRIKNELLILEKFIKKNNNIEDTISTKSVTTANSIKLPKLEINKFDGEPTNWRSFIDSFEATIDNNDTLANVEKMNYLINYLVGEASSTISGLKLSSENYEVALNLLKERYADPQIIISAHMNKLLNLEPVHNILDVKNLRHLYDSTEAQVRSLRPLGLDATSYGPLLIPILLQKLPEELKLVISRQFGGKTTWDIENFLEAFKHELEAREKVSAGDEHFSSNSSFSNFPFSGSTLHNSGRYFKTSPANKPKFYGCVFCGGDHKPQKCTVVTKVDARRGIINKKGHCFVCLRNGHIAKNCRSSIKCFTCKGRHHVAICNPPPPKNDLEKKETVNTLIASQNGIPLYAMNSVLLQTARAKISAPDTSNLHNLRILFDSGSQLTYISPKASEKLKLKTIDQQKIQVKTFGGHIETRLLDRVKICVHAHNDLKIYVTAFVSDICHPVKGQEINIAVENFSHLQNIPLADSNPEHKSLQIDLLIGCDFYWQFINGQIIKGDNGPVALSSKLGYILSGPVNKEGSGEISTNLVQTHVLRFDCEIVDNKLETDKTLKSFWKSENIGIQGIEKSVYDEFNNNIKFEENQYEVKLPFKSDHDVIEDNYSLSLNRLKSLWKKFKKDDKLFEQCDNIIKEQLELGIIEEVPPDVHNVGKTSYLPHRPVIKEDRSTTKVRMVFDASAKNKGPSLNDCLDAGPSLSPSLFGVLLRFRSFNTAIVADIEKAFLQIALNKDDRDYVRFIWFKTMNFEKFEDCELQEYRLCRVLFGVSSSPFLLSATLIHHIMQYSDEDPELVEKILESLHVDDLNSGANTDEEAYKIFVDCKTKLAQGGFNLRKFQSNSSKLENAVYCEFPESKVQIVSPFDNKVLGIIWDKINDNIIFNFEDIVKTFPLNPTKRSILKSIASIFDPLGLINPLILRMKILFQDLCIAKVTWDESLSNEFLDRWLCIIDDLKSVNSFCVQRKYCFNDINDPFISVQLHSFSDASKRAHSSCVYLRFEQVSGNIKTQLVTSKSKVNTITKNGKERTMPRLELQGAFLLSQLTNSVVEQLQSVYTFTKIISWVDSSIVYCWILNTHKKYKQFVQTRLDTIRKLLPQTKWQLISSRNNPADIGSRGADIVDLINSSLWYNGPEFLSLPEEKWPELLVGAKFEDIIKKCTDNVDNLVKNKEEDDASTCITSATDSINLVENKEEDEFSTCLASATDNNLNTSPDNVACLSAATVNNASLSAVLDIRKYGDLTKLLRVTACVLKFIKNLKAHADVARRQVSMNNKNITKNNPGAATGENSNWLTAKDINDARLLWVRDAQVDIHTMKNFKQIKNALNLFTDDNQLLRCKGRLEYASVSYNTNNPWILSKKHRFTELIVLHSHESVGHDGVRETLTHIRNQFWITQPRNYVRKIIKVCRVCKYHEGKAYSYPPEPPLPASRVSLQPAFTYVGLDYAGPIYLKNVYVSQDNNIYKAWIALFTCASSRCIYLDISTDYTGLSCKHVLSRFINRRGAPKQIISDNGSNFTSDEVQNFAATKNIEWKLNIPAAPWTGGFIERMVKSVKRILRKILRNARVTYEEMLTILSDIENIVNNRPLTYLYEEVGEVITPNHLLFGRNLPTVWGGCLENESTETEIDKRAAHIKTVLFHFWNRWQKEYLTELREHRKYNTRNSNVNQISQGDIVLIEEDRLPRSMWRLGRIAELVNSKNGAVRAAVIDVINSKGSRGQMRRPINKLYPLESNIDDKQDEHDRHDNIGITFIDEKTLKMNQ